jgi:DNA-binding transcriptional regulator YbjK
VTKRPSTHRPSAAARRDALLRAAVEIVAERGVGGATHRAIAERAGVPSSTTTYFFSSIDELVVEALSLFATERVEALVAIENALADGRRIDIDRLAAGAADALVAVPASEIIAQFEGYLEAARRPELRGSIAAVIEAFRALAERALAAAGAAEPARGAHALVALSDGFALQRLGRGPDPADAEILRDSLMTLFRAYV